MFNFIQNIGPTELIIIALILIVLFGAKIITSMAKSSGHTVKELKKAKEEFITALKDDDKPVKNK